MKVKETLNSQVDNYRVQFFLAFFTVGLFNNNGYVLVQAGANALAAEFHQGDFMSMFQFVMAVVIAVARYANASWLVNWPHLKRSYVVSAFAIISFLLIAYATIHDENKNYFWVAVGASVFTGAA